MAKIDFNAMRLKADSAKEEAESILAHRRSLVGALHRLIFECSLDGIVALTTFAHMSLISEGFPSEIALGNKSPLKGQNLACQREIDGTWTARASSAASPKGLRPQDLAEAIMAAAHVPAAPDTLETVRSVLNPLADLDFAHFEKVLNLIPLHSLSAMMAHGPTLAVKFGLVSSVDLPRQNGIKFARTIGDTILRRGASVAGFDKDMNSAVDNLLEALGDDARFVNQVSRRFLPTCIEMLDPHAGYNEAFLAEAVRVGFDINAVSDPSFRYPKTVADCIIVHFDADLLARLEVIGLDLSRADQVRSLTSTAISRLGVTNHREDAREVLQLLVTGRGFQVEREAYADLNERISECRRQLHSRNPSELYWKAKHDFLIEARGFIDEHFPALREKSKKRRKIA